MENNEIKKIGFFKKVWYSLTKISKYEEMCKDGIKDSTKYILKLFAVLCIFVSIVACIIQKNSETKIVSEELANRNLPIFEYFLIYYLAYFILFIILYFVYIFLTAWCMWLTTKLYKLNWKFKDSIIKTTYCSTLSAIVSVIYLVVNYYLKLELFFDVIAIILIFIYLFIITYKELKEKYKNM